MFTFKVRIDDELMSYKGTYAQMMNIKQMIILAFIRNDEIELARMVDRKQVNPYKEVKKAA